MKRMLLAVLVLGFAGAAQAQQPSTRDQCDSLVKTVGQTPGKLRSMPFKKLFEAEKFAFSCASTYKVYAYSVVDATISQAMLERCEEFIHERELDDTFFARDAKLYGE